MWTDRYIGRRKALALGAGLGALALAVVIGLLLREYGPGNMGNGFLWGAGLGALGAALMLWRAARRPDRASTFERAWTQTGDERDDAVLTRALAVLGLLAVPLTAVATVAVGLGAAVEMTLALLLFAQIGAGAVAFAVINRSS